MPFTLHGPSRCRPQRRPTRSSRPQPVATTARARRRLRCTTVLAIGAFLAGTGLALAPSGAARAAAPDCGAFDTPVQRLVNPGNGATMLTPWAEEAGRADREGFTDDQGVAFRVADQPGPGLVSVRRLHRSSPQDYLPTAWSGEPASASARYGYRDQGTVFYASTTDSDCLQPVHRMLKGTKHRFVTGAQARDDLVDDGWRYEGVAFYAAPATARVPSDPTPPAPRPPGGGSKSAFSFAVVPDTQKEVLDSGDTRMVNRNRWLVQQRPAFVAQTGDLVNWDTPDHAQTVQAKSAMDVLENAQIPYTVSIGNHDSQATGVGGSARDPANSYALQRDTTTLNAYFTASDFGAVAGAYEPGKIDNVFTTHTAGGLRWMVLSLEFCPRPGVVAWARQVVAAHPRHNVVISTHSYLTAEGALDPSDQGYGDTSGQELFDQLVSQYPNVMMVFSGHVGHASRARIDRGRNGNQIYSFLTAMHDETTNPVRMLDVDPAAGTVKTLVYAPATNTRWDEYTQTLTGVTLVR